MIHCFCRQTDLNPQQVVDLALSNAGVSASELSAIAVTIGPGLSLCLRIGAMKARELARVHQTPLISVHHMEAHALVAR
jgi:N6-L-threonylcarbamoyladenine synthase